MWQFNLLIHYILCLLLLELFFFTSSIIKNTFQNIKRKSVVWYLTSEASVLQNENRNDQVPISQLTSYLFVQVWAQFRGLPWIVLEGQCECLDFRGWKWWDRREAFERVHATLVLGLRETWVLQSSFLFSHTTLGSGASDAMSHSMQAT